MKKLLIFNNDNLILSQGENEDFSHDGIYALDIVNDKLTLNIDVKCIKHYTFGWSTQAYFQSVDKVELADGTVDYLLFYVDHSFNPPVVGKTIKAGKNIIEKGYKGLQPGSQHYHVMYGKGKLGSDFKFHPVKYNYNYDGMSYSPNAFKTMPASKLFWRNEKTKITNSPGLYVTIPHLKYANTDYTKSWQVNKGNTVEKVTATYKDGQIVDKYYYTYNKQGKKIKYDRRMYINGKEHYYNHTTYNDSEKKEYEKIKTYDSLRLNNMKITRWNDGKEVGFEYYQYHVEKGKNKTDFEKQYKHDKHTGKETYFRYARYRDGKRVYFKEVKHDKNGKLISRKEIGK